MHTLYVAVLVSTRSETMQSTVGRAVLGPFVTLEDAEAAGRAWEVRQPFSLDIGFVVRPLTADAVSVGDGSFLVRDDCDEEEE